MFPLSYDGDLGLLGTKSYTEFTESADPDIISVLTANKLSGGSMSTSLARNSSQIVGVEETNGSVPQDDDPFKSTPPSQQPHSHPHPHRFSSFDTQLFASNHPSSSPSQAKRALEAHMAETERRLLETSRLGTALLEQKKRLSERIQDVELQQADGEIGPELRQKLIDIEKEYNEVGRASARAFLGPKPDGQGAGGFNSPFALDGKVSQSSRAFGPRLNQNNSVLPAHQSFLARQ